MFLTKFYKIFKKLYVHKCAYWNEKENSSLEINVTLIPTDFTPLQHSFCGSSTLLNSFCVFTLTLGVP